MAWFVSTMYAYRYLEGGGGGGSWVAVQLIVLFPKAMNKYNIQLTVQVCIV